jgi:hypothetical protein
VAEGTPFLHFWVQVKAGDQCKVAADGYSASCSFSKDKLEYWRRQPVPVFAALVPTDWPPTVEPPVYIVDITSQLLDGSPAKGSSKTLASDFVWRPGVRSDVADFLEKEVPRSTARLQCKKGVLESVPTPSPSYEISLPWVPVKLYEMEISEQIRRTAANAILFLYESRDITTENGGFLKTMASVLEAYPGDPHWETWMGRGISYHADLRFKEAIECYEKAKGSIQGDPNINNKKNWIKWVEKIQELIEKAATNINITEIR